MKTSLPIKHVPKGWGWEKWIVNCEEYCGKLLYFVKGKRCSWHHHKLKDEVFYVQSGKLLVKFSKNGFTFLDIVPLIYLSLKIFNESISS